MVDKYVMWSLIRRLLCSYRQDLEIIKLLSYSTKLSTKFILLINVKMPTIVVILTFISMMNTTSEKQETSLSVRILVFMSS